jgi:uncharacterized repeat protein (TIGR03803 family)
LLGLALPVSFLALLPIGASAAEYRILHQFCKSVGNCPDGFDLAAPLVRDSRGDLYGTASGGGKFGAGTVFRLGRGAGGKWKFDKLHDFCAEDDCADGFDPMAPLIVDGQGNLYGVVAARISSEARDALVYRLHPNGKHWEYQILHEFCSGTACDGEFVNAGLAYAGQSSGAAYDGVSPLFGVSSAGGAHDSGLAFKLEPRNGKWKQTDLYDFCAQADCEDGGVPSQPLVARDASHLVGVAAVGGAGSSGVVFELSSQDGKSWSESVVHAFCTLAHCADGGGTPSSLTLDAAGALYGTTSTGGHCAKDFACGVLFKIAPDGTQDVLFDFCRKVGGCKVGSEPGAGVAVGADGTVYGTTRAGGAPDAGVIYAFDGKMKRLHSFCDSGCQFGGNSLSPMIIDPRGHLFGVTPEGDRGGGGGVVYELLP